MDIQRTVLWVVFSLSLFILWDNWQRYNGNPSMLYPAPAQQAKPAANGKPSLSSVPQAGTVSTTGASAVAAASPAGAAAVPLHSELITITTDVYKAQIDTAGGVLKHLELLQHKETLQREWYAAYMDLFGKTEKPAESLNVVLFDSTEKRTYHARTGLVTGPNHNSLFAAKPGARTLDGADKVQLVLESEQNGVKLTKTFTFKRGDYTIDVLHSVTNASAAPITPSLYLELMRDGNKPEHESMLNASYTGPAVYTAEEHYQKLDFEVIAKKGKEEHATKADNGWIALVQHYFVSAFVPTDKAPREIYTKKVDTNRYAVGTILPLGSIAPGATTNMDARLYSGPQDTAVLEKVAPELVRVKDYGWLQIVAVPIFWLMDQIHKVLGNWGWTIIVLTVMIKLALFPLSAASYRSMGKMKKVTPKMTAIRERHKGDPSKMNQAMMELYKTEKINPLGGCLPMLVQIPVFIALYWVLNASVEMRNAPWIGWIHDLASPDPFYILPVLMAVSMFIQTKLSPTPPDPMQAKVMLFMPIIFSVMFFIFPAGLVLYWVVNNVLGITQQWVITKQMETDTTH